jgi:hypothetical protein
MSQPAATNNPTRTRIEQMSHPAHPLCLDDVIWMMDLIKNKISEPDSQLINQSPAQLLEHFRVFAELAMKLIHGRQMYFHETAQLRSLMQIVND